MNHAKKVISLLLALLMVMSMVGAMAEETARTATVTNGTTGHSYKAYQIFSGTQAEAEGMLGDLAWGTGVNVEGLLNALITAKFAQTSDEPVLTAQSTAADVAALLNNDNAKVFANIVAKNLSTVFTAIAAEAVEVEIATGYYLLVDDTVVDGEDDARNSALLEVVKDITIESKYTTPEVDKVIDEGDGVKVTDKNVGDTVDFKLTGTLPSNYADYDTYKYIFHDTMSPGLTYVEGSLKVYVNDSETPVDSSKYAADVTTAENGTTTITVTFADLKLVATKASDKIVVKYQATLNDKAEVGNPGNPNEVYLKYSTDPNYNGDGTDEPTGETPKDTVVVFTYETVVNKTDANKNPLKGAGFTLYKWNEATTAEEDKWVAVGDEIKGEDLTTFTFKGLDAGKYKLVETTVPSGYNKAADIEFEIVPTYTYNETTKKNEISSLVVKNGETVLSEGEQASFSVAENKGSVSTTVINETGATLPETGGVGTTMLYVGGGALIVIAIALLVSKKRKA